MDAEFTNVNKSFANICELKEEVSEVDTDILSDEKERTSSEEESSTQLCSLSSGQRRNVRSFQRHPSVDEWLLGLPINMTPAKDHQNEVEEITPNIDENIQIDKPNGRGFQNNEAFFQAIDAKETVSEKSAYDFSEKDINQDRKEIAGSFSKRFSSSLNDKEKEDDDDYKEENNGEEHDNEKDGKDLNDDEKDNDNEEGNDDKEENDDKEKNYDKEENDDKEENYEAEGNDKEEEQLKNINSLLKLEIESVLNILVSFSDESQDSGQVLESNIKPNNFQQGNAENFLESGIKSLQIGYQETNGNIVSDLKVLENYEENHPNSKMDNPWQLVASNCPVEEQHKKLNTSLYLNCEPENSTEQSNDLENSQLSESRELCVMSKISEPSIKLEKSDGCTDINEIENKNFQEHIFENLQSTETQSLNKVLDNTTQLIHENNESALPLKLAALDNISSNEKENPSVFNDIEVEKPVYRRSKSLKTCRTPPGNSSCPKLVRFADILGLDLSETRVFADEIPKVPKAAFVDLVVDHMDNNSASNEADLLPRTLIPRPKPLVPLFPQPGSIVQFHDLVRCQKICLESARMTSLTKLTGDVRVLNISFNKNISVLWTVDNWVTKRDTLCEYVPGSSDGVTDKFRFHLDTAGLAEGSRVHLCIKYKTGEHQFWDNNGGENYVFRVGEKTLDQSPLEDFLS